MPFVTYHMYAFYQSYRSRGISNYQASKPVGDTCTLPVSNVKDSGYPHDGRADKNPYPHDCRANKDSYPHDSNNQCIILRLQLSFV